MNFGQNGSPKLSNLVAYVWGHFGQTLEFVVEDIFEAMHSTIFLTFWSYGTIFSILKKMVVFKQIEYW